MFRHVPNLLTGSRLLLAIAFFVMLSFYQYKGRGDLPDHWLLHWAFLTYAVALFTDFLDGYLARKWKIESGFGRIVDPFVDKVLVLGSFIFFAGKNFIVHVDGQPQHVVRTITGVAPGIVVILLARELLITSLRSSSEGGGKNFGAAFSGKVKMVFQSFTILAILLYVNYFDCCMRMRSRTQPICVILASGAPWQSPSSVVCCTFSGRWRCIGRRGRSRYLSRYRATEKNVAAKTQGAQRKTQRIDQKLRLCVRLCALGAFAVAFVFVQSLSCQESAYF